LSSFFTSFDTESYAEGYEVIHFPNANDTSSNFANQHSLIKNNDINSNVYMQSGMVVPHNFNSFLNSSIVQIVEVGDFSNSKKSEFIEDILKPSTNSFYYNSDNFFTDNNLLKYLPKNEMPELNINNNKINSNNNNDTINNNDDSKKANKKRSMPNLTFNDKRDVSQFSTPYLTKGKLCGQFKVRILSCICTKI